MTTRIKSLLPYLNFAFAVSFVLCWSALLLPWLSYGEGRDTLWYTQFLFFLPAFLFLYQRSGLDQPRFGNRLPMIFLGVLAAVNGGLQCHFLMKRFSPFIAVTTGVVATFLDFAVSWAVGRYLFRKSGWEKGFGFFIMLTYLTMKVSDDNRFLPWLGWNSALSVVVILAFGALTWYALLRKAPDHRPVTKERFAVTALVLLAFVSALSLFPQSKMDAYHLSYYWGPISMIQQGAIPLYSVPSQYGFLSILFPALLSGSPAEALRFALALLLAIQSAATYLALRASLSRGSVAWALLMTVALTFFVAGDHFGIGVFARPSASAYRFVWVYLFVLSLVHPQRSERRRRFNQALLFSIGCLWSAESAFYCFVVLAGTTAAETFVSIRNGKFLASFRSFSIPGICLTSLIAAVIFIELLYRREYGFGPDWHLYADYVLSYSMGFGALAAEPWGALNALFASLILALAFVVWRLKEGSEEEARYAAIAFGMLGTMSYFVSRSHPQNVCNLFAFWFPWLALLARHAEETDAKWGYVFRAHLALLAVGLFAVGVGDGTAIKSVFAATRRPPATVLPPELLAKTSPTVPFESWTEEVSFADGPDKSMRPWLPTHPWDMLGLLPLERQEIIMDRYLDRHVTSQGLLLRNVPPNATEAVWLYQIERHYRKVDSVPVGRAVLETYERR